MTDTSPTHAVRSWLTKGIGTPPCDPTIHGVEVLGTVKGLERP